MDKISIDPQICVYSDRGTPFVLEYLDFKSTKVFMEIVEKIKEFLKTESRGNQVDESRGFTTEGER